ncbi:hypothetical protein Esti_005253 [Eimeria stiedai]
MHAVSRSGRPAVYGTALAVGSQPFVTCCSRQASAAARCCSSSNSRKDSNARISNRSKSQRSHSSSNINNSSSGSNSKSNNSGGQRHIAFEAAFDGCLRGALVFVCEEHTSDFGQQCVHGAMHSDAAAAVKGVGSGAHAQPQQQQQQPLPQRKHQEGRMTGKASGPATTPLAPGAPQQRSLSRFPSIQLYVCVSQEKSANADF